MGKRRVQSKMKTRRKDKINLKVEISVTKVEDMSESVSCFFGKQQNCIALALLSMKKYGTLELLDLEIKGRQFY